MFFGVLFNLKQERSIILIRHVFIDNDYTLRPFDPGHETAIERLAEVYGAAFGKYVDLWFRTILHGLRAKEGDWSDVPGGESAFTQLINELKAIQGTETFNIWSREIGCMWAAKKSSLPMTPQAAIEAADIYWICHADHSEIYPDAEAFLRILHEQNIAYHVFTSSDARLCFRNGVWVYDPEYSARKKLERMTSPNEDEALRPASITVGDPEDKPSDAFYYKMMSNAIGVSGGFIDCSTCITVGDSYQGDVKVPLTLLGFARGYWIPNRHAASEKLESNIYTIHELTEIDLV